MLLCSAAAQMIRKEEGKVIISDRFILSTALFWGRECKWILQKTRTHASPTQGFDQTKYYKLNVARCAGLPLLWCFQPKDKSHGADTDEVSRGGFQMNPGPCRACSGTKHQSMKVTKGNRRSFEKMSKS